MIFQWLVYGLLVSVLLSATAWLAEQGSRAQRWPTRWIWAAAMAGSVGLPLVAWLNPAPAPAAPSVVAAPTALVLESISAVGPGAAETAVPATALGLAAWAVLSVLLLAIVAVLALRLHFRRRGWGRETVDGVDVWVSRRTGPAALGVLRGHVVGPEWALSLDPARRRLLVLHEAEHVRARDPQLALAALVVCALVPWNLPLWWQVRRLRLAIEVDCDERVLRHAGDRRGYGSLLLEVSQRKAHLALALAESRSMLERRIRMITKTTGPATLRAIALAAVAGLVLAVACETPEPMGPADAGANTLTLPDVSLRYVSEEGACEPILFVNGSRSSQGVLESLEPSGIESIQVFKGGDLPSEAQACGVVAILTKNATTEERAAARRVVEDLSRARREAAGQEDPVVPVYEEVESEPTFTPMTVRPQLRNADEVRAALQSEYPASLKAQGIGGATNVWFLIDEEGAVRKALVNETSGYDELDAAALEVAQTMEFTPAYNRDQRVPVWIAMDIRFEAQ